MSLYSKQVIDEVRDNSKKNTNIHNGSLAMVSFAMGRFLCP